VNKAEQKRLPKKKALYMIYDICISIDCFHVFSMINRGQK